MMRKLETDYMRMKTMIFSDIPALSDIIETIRRLEARLNTPVTRLEPSLNDTPVFRP
jgi:hypothetical protein